MTRLRVAAALAGLGALALCGPVSALVAPDQGAQATSGARSTTAALALLENAVRATRERAWSGTQHVVSMVTGAPVVTQLQVQHLPGRGSALADASGAQVLTADVLDDSLLSLLAETYDLRVLGGTTCGGRSARVVEVRRPGTTGPAAVAGRFWLDQATGLVLRRDVLGPDGALVRSSELTGLHAGPQLDAEEVAETAGSALRPHGERLSPEALLVLDHHGWRVPRTLPGGMVLFDARLLDGQVLQLSYSDGLSTASLFGQRGELPPTTTGVVRTVAGGRVWLTPGQPGRVVWSEHGRTWTLVSEAPPRVMDDIVAALPHGRSRVTEDGLAPRFWRGVARVGAWMNPFD